MLLALTAVVALAVFAVGGERNMATGVVLIMLLCGFPAVSLVGCLSTAGYRRAFFIGTLAPSLVCWFHFERLTRAPTFFMVQGSGFGLDATDHIQAIVAICWLCIVPLGLLCVAFRWLLVRGSEGDTNEP
ncbi:MAG: hypothetical protein WD847_18745 [Pirellulales bacterium]